MDTDCDPELFETVTFETRDLDELVEASTDWDLQYFQMAPGAFSGGISMTQIGTRQIFRERWSLKTRYQGTAPPGAFGFALPLSQAGTASWVGQPADIDTVVFQSPGQEADLLSSEHLDFLGLGIPEEEVEAILSALTGRDGFSSQFHGVVTLKADIADEIRRNGRVFLNAVQNVSSESKELLSRYSEQFVRLFLWELVNALQDQSASSKPGRTAETVRKATELVMSDSESVLGLTEICGHLGVSLRTLHYAFQDVTGMPPATWLRRIRLNRAHATLLRSSPDEKLVKQVALKNGFLHLSHFSAQYERYFGCLPSQTLHS